MSTSITTSFVRQYEREVHEVFQRTGAYLLPTVRWKNKVKGSSTTFQKIGKGIATTKSRHGTITPMNQTHTAIQVTLADFYAGDYFDKLDEAKIDHDERSAIARGGAASLGRKVDNQIITVLNTTTATGVTSASTTMAAFRNVLLNMDREANENDVPNDGRRFGALTPNMWAFAMTVDAFSRAEYIDWKDLPYMSGVPHQGKFKRWLNANWQVHNDLPGVGSTSSNGYLWHHDAVGYASNVVVEGMDQAMGADITWHGERAAWFINHMMSGEAGMIDDTGVIESTHDDAAALPIV